MDALGLNRYCCRRMVMVRRPAAPACNCAVPGMPLLGDTLLGTAAAATHDADWTADVPPPAASSCSHPPPLTAQTHVDLIEKLLNYNTLERNPVQQREQREQPPQQQQQQQGGQ